MYKKSIFASLALSLICLTLYAQNNEGRYKSISFKVMSGGHLYSGVNLEDEVKWGYSAVDIRFAWHPSKDNQWSKDTGFAAYGVGFYNAFVGDPKLFGDPTALYGFVNFFLSKPWRRNVMEISPALGLTYHLQPYDPETNPTQDALGSRIAVYFNVHFGGAYKFNRELDLTYGVDFTHYSNGRTWQPNYGLNLFGLNAGIRYHWNQAQKALDSDPYTTNVVPARFNRPEKPEKEEADFAHSIDLYLAGGVAQNESDIGTDLRYGTFSGVIDYRHYFNRMHGASAGIDVFYDNSLAENYADNADRFLLGVHAGYDFMFWRFNIRAQLGTYLTDDRGKGAFFMRPSIHYKISKQFFAQVGLKTKNGAAADWVEFGLGWKPFRW